MLVKTDKRITNKNWRINHLYKIINKEGKLVTFQLNKAQEKLNKEKHTRNIILKARQRGITTYELIDGLDDVLFNRNFNFTLIAHRQEDAKKIFKKAKLALKHFPLKDYYQVTKETQEELEFEHGSNLSVTVSARSSTVNRLHISEFGYISRHFPERAEEIITGSIPAVVPGGRIDIESTAEGETGRYYELYTDSENRGEPTAPQEFKAHFFSWTDAPEYRLKGEFNLPQWMREYQKKQGLSIEQANWYYQEWKTQKEKMKQEYPSCVEENTIISTKKGLTKIKDVEVDGQYILAKYDQGIKQNYLLKTKLGYELECTDDHKILVGDGYKELKDISEGEFVKLGKPNFNDKIQKVKYNDEFVNCEIKINKRFARFLGLFMGDGCFGGRSGTVSISCDGQEKQVIKEVKDLYNQFLGGWTERVVGNKNGCVEVRKSNVRFLKPFKEMDLIKKSNGSYNGTTYKRNICVPNFIKQSPKSVVSEFLKGLFEADGFVSRPGTEVKFFTKYEKFAKDVQILLLKFGITCRLAERTKKSGSGGTYIGYEISLRREETKEFKRQIGFISDKKRNRINLYKNSNHANCLQLKFEDEIVSIQKTGKKRVYDITTSTSNFIANGIIVHNCSEEAFEGSGRKMFPIEIIREKLRTEVEEGDKSGNWVYYEAYRPGHNYALGADVSEGIGGDSSTIVIIDTTINKVVARYANNQISPDLFAFEVKNGAEKYGNCIVGVERNNHGHATLGKLKEIYSLQKIYREWKEDIITKKQTERLGWNTNLATKPRIFNDLKTTVEENLLKIPDKALLNEMKTYDIEELNRIKADEDATSHYDILTACAIAWEMRKHIVKSPVNIIQKRQNYAQERRND